MLVLALALGVALLIPLVTRGSYTKLVMTPWRWGVLLFAGLGIQIALEFASIPEDRWHDVGFGLLVASYVLILGFCFGNLLVKGMAIVLVGVACNALVIAANQGMPVEVPPDWEAEAWIEPTIKHRPSEPGDRLMFLADIIVLRAPFDTVLSFGDLILAVGLCDVTFHASRRGRARRRRAAHAPRGANAEAGGTDPQVAINLAALERSDRNGVRADRPLQRAHHPFVVDVSGR